MKVMTPNPAGKTVENEIIPASNYPRTIQNIWHLLKKMPYTKPGYNIPLLAVGHLSFSTLDEGIYPIR